MSHMSWCGGPPPRKMLMTDFGRLRGASAARASVRRMSASDKRKAADAESADLEEAAPRDAVAKTDRFAEN